MSSLWGTRQCCGTSKNRETWQVRGGVSGAMIGRGVAPQARARPRAVKPKSHIALNTFSWNAGGLNAGVFRELVAWLAEAQQYQVAVLQETHWKHMDDFRSGPWQCVHTSGYDGGDSLTGQAACSSCWSTGRFKTSRCRSSVQANCCMCKLCTPRQGFPSRFLRCISMCGDRISARKRILGSRERFGPP